MPNLNTSEGEGWEKQFDEKFVCDTNSEEHPFVAFYNEEENKFEFWNAYKIKDFIHTLRSDAIGEYRNKIRDELLKKARTVDYADRNEYDEAVEIIDKVLTSMKNK